MIAPARWIALALLEQIATTHAHSDELLHTRRVNELSAQDRNLVTTLVLGTLRWQLALDQILLPMLADPERPLPQSVRAALRMGAYQLLHLDRVPAHAVLHDSVEWVKQSDDAYMAGMVNAVLRKVTRQQKSTLKAASAAYPAWMVRRWQSFYGAESALRICESGQRSAPAVLRVLDPFAAHELEREGALMVPAEWMTDSRRLLSGEVGLSTFVSRGQLSMQDQGSQLVAKLAAVAMPEATRVLDACAAPGGKTAVLADHLPKAHITAMEVQARRYRRMCTNLSRYADRIYCVQDDAETVSPGPQYDLILCDVPCSGTGTLGRNPEIRLRLYPEDLLRQQERQIRILTNLARSLRPGGRIVYSTCSLEPEENEQVIKAVLGQAVPGQSDLGQSVLEATELRITPMEPLVDQLTTRGMLTPQGAQEVRAAVREDALRTLPGVHPTDGFFAVVLERASVDFSEEKFSNARP